MSHPLGEVQLSSPVQPKDRVKVARRPQQNPVKQQHIHQKRKKQPRKLAENCARFALMDKKKAATCQNNILSSPRSKHRTALSDLVMVNVNVMLKRKCVKQVGFPNSNNNNTSHERKEKNNTKPEKF